MQTRRKDGAVRDVSMAAEQIELDGEPCILTMVQDITERKRAEEALRESEDRHRLLFDTSMDAIVMTAPDGRIFAANPAACRMFGRTEEDLVRLGRDAVVDASDPRLAAGLNERARTGMFSGEITMIRADGTKFAAELTTSLFKDRDGQPRTSMIIRDITGRKRGEEALRQSETRFRELFENMSSGVAVYEAVDDGRDFMIKDFNAAAERIESVSRDQVIGRRVTEAFPGVEAMGLLDVFR